MKGSRSLIFSSIRLSRDIMTRLEKGVLRSFGLLGRLVNWRHKLREDDEVDLDVPVHISIRLGMSLIKVRLNTKNKGACITRLMWVEEEKDFFRRVASGDSWVSVYHSGKHANVCISLSCCTYLFPPSNQPTINQQWPTLGIGFRLLRKVLKPVSTLN